MGRTWRPRSLHPDACEKTALTSRRADSAAEGRPRPSAARPHAGWLHAARGGDRDLGRAQGPAGAGERRGQRGTRDVKGERSLPRPTPDATCKRQAVRAAGGGIAETAVAVKRRLTAAWSTYGGERCAPQRQISQETRGPA